MLFGNLFGNKIYPRRFIYTPRYYDPETDEDRSARISFDKSPLRSSTRKHAGGGTWTMLVVVVVIIALIAVLQRVSEQQVDLSRVTLESSDAAPVETSQVPQNISSGNENGYIEQP